ncbi:Cilia- and flagella-associated protein 58 [Gryllus bimaculatus]|nr:Cilia- and flagella-associated protein 58 [Gryllus bimaculatus]
MDVCWGGDVGPGRECVLECLSTEFGPQHVNVSAEQAQTLRLQEQARRATADELDVHVVAARRQRKQINNLELERDRLLIQSTELEVRVQETLEEVRLKQMALYETRRCIEEGEARFRHQQNLSSSERGEAGSTEVVSQHLLVAKRAVCRGWRTGGLHEEGAAGGLPSCREAAASGSGRDGVSPWKKCALADGVVRSSALPDSSCCKRLLSLGWPCWPSAE